LAKIAENCDHNIDPWSPWSQAPCQGENTVTFFSSVFSRADLPDFAHYEIQIVHVSSVYAKKDIFKLFFLRDDNTPLKANQLQRA
jgi:hypothetical protein